jgi:hypothetical protein
MYFEIVRNPNLSDINGTFGELYIDGEPFCATCERPWNNNEPNSSCIPEGDVTPSFFRTSWK